METFSKFLSLRFAYRKRVERGWSLFSCPEYLEDDPIQGGRGEKVGRILGTAATRRKRRKGRKALCCKIGWKKANGEARVSSTSRQGPSSGRRGEGGNSRRSFYRDLLHAIRVAGVFVVSFDFGYDVRVRGKKKMGWPSIGLCLVSYLIAHARNFFQM